MVSFRILNTDPVGDYREAALTTQGLTKDDVAPRIFADKDAEVRWWVRQIVANHSILRSVRFRMTGRAPKSVVMQLIRATKGHPQPEVQSSRPDWTGKERSSDPYVEVMFMQDHTAESFVEMARQRLCRRTEERTRTFMRDAVDMLLSSDEPFLRALGLCCHPACVWYHGCPETNPCSPEVKRLADVFLRTKCLTQ